MALTLSPDRSVLRGDRWRCRELGMMVSGIEGAVTDADGPLWSRPLCGLRLTRACNEEQIIQDIAILLDVR